MTVADINKSYEFFKLIKNSSFSTNKKRQFIEVLFADYENNWEPIGITIEALKACHRFNYDKISNKKHSAGIERAHISNRAETFDIMLEKEWQSAEEWWEFYLKRNKTILSLSCENKAIGSGKLTEWIHIDKGYFKNARIGYSYKKRDKEYLKDLGKKNL